MTRRFYVGGTVREDWRPEGLLIQYEGATEVFCSAGVYSCSDSRLASLLNGSRAPVDGKEILLRRYADFAGDETAIAQSDALWILEHLRLLLDIQRMDWDSAKAKLANQLVCHFPLHAAGVAMSALDAVQPRLAALARTLEAELSCRAAERWPDDPRRRIIFSMCRGGILDAGLLCYHCAGRCMGSLADSRDFYVLTPEKFEV